LQVTEFPVAARVTEQRRLRELHPAGSLAAPASISRKRTSYLRLFSNRWLVAFDSEKSFHLMKKSRSEVLFFNDLFSMISILI